MLSRTHFVFNLFIFFLFLKFHVFSFSLAVFLIFFFATALPDIDIAGSWISRKTKPLSNLLHVFTKHREEFHSLLFALAYFLIIFLISRSFSLGAIGFLFYFSHLFLDGLTISGIKWFWPSKFRIHGIIKTGSLVDIIIFILFSFASIFLIISMI